MSPSGGLKHFHLQRKQLIKTVQGPLKGERQMMQAGDEGVLGLCWLSLFSRTFELFILVFSLSQAPPFFRIRKVLFYGGKTSPSFF